jgi:hypothetical protein
MTETIIHRSAELAPHKFTGKTLFFFSGREAKTANHASGKEFSLQLGLARVQVAGRPLVDAKATLKRYVWRFQQSRRREDLPYNIVLSEALYTTVF